GDNGAGRATDTDPLPTASGDAASDDARPCGVVRLAALVLNEDPPGARVDGVAVGDQYVLHRPRADADADSRVPVVRAIRETATVASDYTLNQTLRHEVRTQTSSAGVMNIKVDELATHHEKHEYALGCDIRGRAGES